MQKQKVLPPKPSGESWKRAVLDNLAESMAYLTEAHTSLILAKEESAGRLEDSFSAALQLFEELNCELALLQRRAVCEKGH